MKLPMIIFSLAMAAVTAHAAESLEVDQTRSRIQVDIKATGHWFTSELKGYQVSASGDQSTLAPASFQLDWNFKKLDSDDKSRDAKMVDWLGGGEPKGTFKWIKSWKEKDGSDRAMGSLTIHGVTKTISFPYKVEKAGDWVTISGQATLDYKDFGLSVIRMTFMTVDPKLLVRFHVVGKVK